MIPASVRREVLNRDDNHCVAPIVDPDGAGQCGDRFGRMGYRVPITHLELDHVGEMRMGKAAPTDAHHLVTLCPHHHRGLKAGANWATANRPLLRDYLASKQADLGAGEQLSTIELHWAAFSSRQRMDAGL